ncbi:MAG TPA: CARDB domain-containing protein [Phototrophicaceae bacterium]|nr:CARDB domain-containing protein [Phototrophicaceae bacterium]
MRRNLCLLFILALISLSACNLTTDPETNEPINVPTINPGGKPVVTITSPKEGDEIVVGSAMFVTANARDAVGVTRVQLLANDQIVKTISSESSSGQTNFDVLLDYKPREQGEVTLELIAYRNAIASDPAIVTVNVRANQAQVTATAPSQPKVPIIDPNDPTCRVLTNVGLRMRSGPNVSFAQVALLNAGSVAPITRRTGINDWYEIRYGTNTGWIAAQNPANPNEKYVSLYGNCSSVPVYAPTPTPTIFVPPTAFPTLTPAPTNTPLPSATPGRPDLIVTSISGESAVTIPSGSTQVIRQYAVTISNLGTGPSSSFNNRITLPGGLDADLGVVSNLDPGVSIVLTANATFTAAGSYEIRVSADSSSTVTEVSDVNNFGSLLVTVTGP